MLLPLSFKLALGLALAFAPPSETPNSQSSEQGESEAPPADGEDEDEDEDEDADEGENAQRLDWKEGLRQGFAWKFKHGSQFRLGGVMTGQGVLGVDEDVGAEAGFRLVHSRLLFVASFFDRRLQAVVQPEFAGGVRLLDTEVSARFDDAFSVRVGLYRPNFMRDFRVNIPLLALPTRGFVHDTFTTGRRVGANIEGQPLDGKLEYSVGVYNGNAGEGLGQAKASPANALVTARVAFNPMGATPYTQTAHVRGRGAKLADTKLSIGLNLASERAPLNATPLEGTRPISSQRTTFAADVALLDPRGWVSVTGVRRWHPAPRGSLGSSGGYLMAGVPLRGTIFDLTMRTGVVDPANARAQGEHEAAVNAYIVGNNLRVTAAYNCGRYRGFGPGCSRHAFTAQARLAF